MSDIRVRLSRLEAALARQGDARLVAALIGAFIASRLAFRAVGVRFFSESLDYFLQYLDPELLRSHLTESLFYLHTQPPLFNLFLGLVLKTSPGFEREVFAACFAAIGLASGVLLFALLRGLRVSRLFSLSASLLFLLSPGSVAFENFLLYDLPVMALLLLAAVALLRFARSNRWLWLCVFSLSLTALGFTRSMFHLAYLAGIAGVLAIAAGRNARPLVAACAVSALLLATLFVKNELLFDRFTSSTWLGMSLAKMTRVGLDDSRLRELYARGRISKLALRPPFEQIEVVGYAVPERFRGVPALARPVKSTGAVNFNYIAYIELSEQLGRDARAMFEEAPDGYWNSQVEAWSAFFEPAGNATYQTVRLPWRYLDVWNRTVFGRLPIDLELHGRPIRVHVLLVAGILASLGCAGAFVSRTSWREALDDPERIAITFMVATTAYVVVVGNALDWGENYRTRLYVEPYLVAFLALGMRQLVRTRTSDTS